jgi:hypothetical protein
MTYKEQSRIIRWIGAVMLIVGIAAAILGPVEMYCYYLFGEGGCFHYPGFGFGSLVFASIAWQNIGYYLIAVVCIALGIGHLTLRRWARSLSLAGLGAWLVVGIPLTLVTLAILVSFKAMTILTFILSVGAALLLYPGLPIILLRFYRTDNVRLTFEMRDANSHWTERMPTAVLVLAMLLFFYWVVTHVPLFFNGVFPFFGILFSGLPGIIMTTAVLLSLMALLWGVIGIKKWAWWGTLGLLCAVILSTALTLFPLSFQDLVSAANLPPLESNVMQDVPLRGVHITLFIDMPVLVTIGLLLISKRYFLIKGKNTVLDEKLKPSIM